VEVSDEDFLLQRPDVSVEQVQPLAVVPDLVHVDVPRGDVLIAALKPRVLLRRRTEVRVKGGTRFGLLLNLTGVLLFGQT